LQRYFEKVNSEKAKAKSFVVDFDKIINGDKAQEEIQD
jgi:hypothetical protein